VIRRPPNFRGFGDLLVGNSNLFYTPRVEVDLAIRTISRVTIFEFMMKVCSEGTVCTGTLGKSVSLTVSRPSFGSSPKGE
jgi:hypothetical protein